VAASWSARLLAESEELAGKGGAPLAGLAAAIRDATDRLEQPLRLAVAGQNKRGKSTLVNALLGDDVAATGQLELTFTVSEFRYADPPQTTAVYRGGGREDLSPAVLRGLTIRSSEDIERLRSIRKIEYGLPNDLLLSFHLIDTPGLGSVYQFDSANALEVLGLGGFAAQSELAEINKVLTAIERTPEQIHGESVAELSRAEAILYLFSRALHERDQGAVDNFVGHVAPLKAFGVLSRCDLYWPPSEDLPGAPDPLTYNPIDVGEQQAREYLERPEIQKIFFTVIPVSGLVGIGARMLTPAEFDWLDVLSEIQQELLVSHLSDVNWFATRETLDGITIDAGKRQALVNRLGAWGIHLACGYLRAGLSRDDVRERLLADSGVSRLRELIIGHFGGQSALIKLDYGLTSIATEAETCLLAAERKGGPVPGQIIDIVARIEKIRNREHGFAELAVLSDHYNGRLSFDPRERAELLDIMGVNGKSAAMRLGQPEGTSLQELGAVALKRAANWAQWAEGAVSPDHRSANAATVVSQSYTRIARLIERATQMLESGTDNQDEV
jgi:Dynamin family